MSKPLDEKALVSADLGYDRGEPQIFGVVGATLVTVLILAVVGVGVQAYYDAYKERLVESYQLQPVSQDLLDLRAKEDQALNSYGIADKATNAVRLPISRAMELTAAESKEGKPKYPTNSYTTKKPDEVPAAAPNASAGAPTQQPAPPPNTAAPAASPKK